MMQFGHNDQKADKGISVAQFKINLGKMVDEGIYTPSLPPHTPILFSLPEKKQ